MVTFPPFLPSSRWYAEWLNTSAIGMRHHEACAEAFERSGCQGKDLARCRLDNGNNDVRMMGVPVEGGSHTLKNVGKLSVQPCISSHGNWRHNHLGTLEAIYGRHPYFQHIIPDIEDIYLDTTVLTATLPEFNNRMHTLILTFLGIGDPEPMCTATIIKAMSSPITRERGMELASVIRPDISIIDAIMRYGRETLLALPLLTKRDLPIISGHNRK